MKHIAANISVYLNLLSKINTNHTQSIISNVITLGFLTVFSFLSFPFIIMHMPETFIYSICWKVT